MTSCANGVYWTMVFIETPTFTRLIASLLDDEDYSKLQEEDNILMLVAYAKNVKDNLTAQETEILRKLVKEL